MDRWWKLSLALILILSLTRMAPAAEIPSEHPVEHPEEEGLGRGRISLEELTEAIRSYVERDTRLKGGYFLIYDQRANKPLLLSLVRIHQERLSRVGKDLYFACVDFKTPEGKLYDLDIFMKGTEKGNLRVTEITIHKEAGRARYTWYREDGLWKKRPVMDH